MSEERAQEAVEQEVQKPLNPNGRSHIEAILAKIDDANFAAPPDVEATPQNGSFAAAGTNVSAIYNPRSATGSRAKPIDWWSFEYALAAGRRWRQIVRQKQNERQQFEINRTEQEWRKRKRKEHEGFMKGRDPKVMKTVIESA